MLDYTHLEALLAVNKEGSFEAAARALGMSPIGVATRIRKLEERMGVPLLSRKPTRPNEAGTVLCSYAQRVASLETDLIADQKTNALQPADKTQTIRIAISDESQHNWLSNAYGIKRPDAEEPWLLDVVFIDQDHTVQHMRNGEVIAALSSSRQPIHGFKSHLLGSIDHRAVASPDFIKQHFPDGVSLQTLTNTPCIRRSDDDELCYQWLTQSFGASVALTCFRMPNLSNLVELCLKGNGWAVLPEATVNQLCQSGDLCELVPGNVVEKGIYWHIAAIMADELTPITKALREAFSQ